MMRRAYALPLIAIVVLALGTQGCDDGTWNFEIEGHPVPIGSPETSIYDPSIVGVWEREDEFSGQIATLILETRDMQTYRIAIYEGRESEPSRGEGFAVDVEGIRFLNIKLDDLPGFLFLRYSADPQHLTLRGVDPGSEGTNADELLAWITSRLHDEELYSEPEQYTRVALWSHFRPSPSTGCEAKRSAG